MTSRVQRPSADATRDRILSASVTVFAERGFEGTSLREVARRADVSQPLLNYHFQSKTELWQAALERLIGHMRERLRSRSEGLRGVDDVTTAKLLIREFVHFSAEHPQLHRIILYEASNDSERLTWLVDHQLRRGYEWITRTFAGLRAQGVVPDIAPLHMYYLLTGAAPSMFVFAPECRRLSGVDPLQADVVSAHADALIALIFCRNGEATS